MRLDRVIRRRRPRSYFLPDGGLTLSSSIETKTAVKYLGVTRPLLMSVMHSELLYGTEKRIPPDLRRDIRTTCPRGGGAIPIDLLSFKREQRLAERYLLQSRGQCTTRLRIERIGGATTRKVNIYLSKLPTGHFWARRQPHILVNTVTNRKKETRGCHRPILTRHHCSENYL
ncbi:hypothetical protein J6590_042233 [Homalodisca vitripennis]|nr:hypothetical protein J6590_042233 [Homalodisca vitripennis]